MKTIVGILTRMILILLILMNVVSCFDKSPNSGKLTAGYAVNKGSPVTITVDTGQIVCMEYSDGHVSCTCYR